MSEQAPEPDQVTKVARDLSEIVALFGSLEDQAIAAAADPLMPGGAAMVALGPEASPDEWAERIAAAELRHFTTCQKDDHSRCVVYGAEHVEDEDDQDNEPVLRTLVYWSEDWRRIHGYPLPPHVTVESEANFIRWALNWAWGHEDGWDDFAEDIHRAKLRLENLLMEGKRATRGVRCFDCDVDLVRTSSDRSEPRFCSGDGDLCRWPHRFCPHDRGGLGEEWVCPSCQRRYDVEQYRRAVAQAHFVHAEWLAAEECAQRTGVQAGTIRVWATRDKVAKRRNLETGRMMYRVSDVLRRAEEDVA